MNTVEQRYLRTIRSRVCQQCPDFLPDGMCGLAGRVCPIERNLHEIVLLVHYVHDDSIQAYLDELRRMVCASCPSEDANGRCELRQQRACPLDRYFVLVVEAIEEVHEQIRLDAPEPAAARPPAPARR